MFVQMICERLADFKTNDDQRTSNQTPAKMNVRETELTSDNDNEQRLIQRGDSDEQDLEEPWDEEKVPCVLGTLCFLLKTDFLFVPLQSTFHTNHTRCQEIA